MLHVYMIRTAKTNSVSCSVSSISYVNSRTCKGMTIVLVHKLITRFPAYVVYKAPDTACSIGNLQFLIHRYCHVKGSFMRFIIRPVFNELCRFVFR
jgi:hypothetical protein